MKTPTLACIAGTLFVCAACSSTGLLGQSALTPPCAAGDTTCQQQGGVSSPLAAGSTFALEVTPVIAGGTAIPLTLEAVDGSVASVDDDGIVHAVGPGITAILVLAEDGAVVDFTHVAVAKAARATFHRGGGADVDERALPEHIQVLPNEQITLSLRVWQHGQQLIGEMGDVWRVDGEGFRILDEGFAQERLIQAPAAGTAVVTATLVGVQQTLTLEVVP